MATNESPQSDPRLKAAAAEIKAIVEKYDIGGFICLASNTHCEFLTIFPDWSVVQRDGHTGYRIRIKKEEHSHEQVETSMHVVYGLRDMAGLGFQNFETVCAHLSQQLDVQHRSFSGLWDLDGWEKPDLPPAPSRVIDFKKRRKRRGFGRGGDR